MNNIHRLNLILGLLVLALLVFSLQQNQNEYTPISTYQASDINNIKLISKQRQLEFSKHNNLWSLPSSPDKPVQQAHIEKLLGILKTHSYRQFENNENNRKAFGLNAATGEMILNDMQILYGTTDPTTDNRYILFNNQIHLITDLYYQYLLAGEAFFSAAQQ